MTEISSELSAEAKAIIEKTGGFIHKNGTPLQIAAYEYVKNPDNKNRDELIEQLGQYQNDDGGWANGIEVEYQGTVSSPMAVAAALGYLYLFNLKNTTLYEKTLMYLEKNQLENGSWDDVEAINQFEIPPYMGPSIYVEYKTGMIIKWLTCLELDNKELLTKGIQYMISVFDSFKESGDMWSALAYVNAFAKQDDSLSEKGAILQWAGGVLSTMQQESQEMAWFMLQGMIYDDDPALLGMKEDVIGKIRDNQLPDGSWPHKFGVYNQVWAAILIARFLEKA